MITLCQCPTCRQWFPAALGACPNTHAGKTPPPTVPTVAPVLPKAAPAKAPAPSLVLNSARWALGDSSGTRFDPTAHRVTVTAPAAQARKLAAAFPRFATVRRADRGQFTVTVTTA